MGDNDGSSNLVLRRGLAVVSFFDHGGHGSSSPPSVALHFDKGQALALRRWLPLQKLLQLLSDLAVHAREAGDLVHGGAFQGFKRIEMFEE